MSRRLRLFTAILAVIMVFSLIPVQCFAEEPPIGEILQWVSPENENASSCVKQASGGLYLFLPASADYRELSLRSAYDAVLMPSVGQNASLSLSAGQTVSVDLTVLFGEMRAGTVYSVFLKLPNGQNKTIKIIKSEFLPSLYVNIDKDLKLIDQSPDKTETASGSYTLLTAEGALYKAGEVNEFRGRGNSSWVRSNGKQPYNLKLAISEELIPGAGNSKKWCLVSDNVAKHDITGLSNRAAMEMYRKLNGLYALSSESVDLFVNGDYRGTYMLSEKVTFSDGSIPIEDSEYTNKDTANRTLVIRPGGVTAPPRCWDQVPLRGEELSVIYADSIQGDEALDSGIQAYQYADGSVLSSMKGYLLEIDFRFYAETCWFVTRRGYAFVIRDPKYASANEVRRIAAAVQKAEDALFSENGYLEDGVYYADLMDIDSFAKVYLVDSFTTNRDAHRASSFCTASLDENGKVGKLYAGPIWDYNSTALYTVNFFGNDIGTTTYYICWMEQMVQHGDFLSALQGMNSETLIPMLDGLRDGGLDQWIEELTPSQTMNNILWANNFSFAARQFQNEFIGRINVWEKELWNEKRLLGVTAEYDRDTNTITADVKGTAVSYQWYRVNEADWSGEPVEGAVNSSFSPDTEGIYYVAALGKSLIYGGRAAMKPGLYTVNGFHSLTANETAPLFSNPVDTRILSSDVVEEQYPYSSEPGQPETDTPKIQENEEDDSAEEISFLITPTEPEEAPKDADSSSFPLMVYISAVTIIAAALLIRAMIRKGKRRKKRKKTYPSGKYQSRH